jgi:hypothetical protein
MMPETLEQRIARLEKQNRQFQREIAGLKGESDSKSFDRIKRAGETDASRLPSASAQIRPASDVRERREDKEFAAALAEIAGRDALQQGFKTTDALIAGAEGGYRGEDIWKVARKMGVSGDYVQNVLERARQNLRKV